MKYPKKVELKMDKINEQYQEIISKYPGTFLMDKAISHLIIPLGEEIYLELNFRKYPKRPKSKLINKDGKIFKLNQIVTSLREWNESQSPKIIEVIDEVILLVKNMKSNEVLISKDFINGMVRLCREQHPQKMVGLLSVKKGIVKEFILPSRACTDPLKDFEIFRTSCSIPFDISYEGTFLSRPSGDLKSNEKLNKIFKRRWLTILLAYPYELPDCLKCFNSSGHQMKYIIVEENNFN